MKFKVLLVIPARFNSFRLPGKPLKKIGNKTLIQRVYERAMKVNSAIFEKYLQKGVYDKIYGNCFPTRHRHNLPVRTVVKYL